MSATPASIADRLKEWLRAAGRALAVLLIVVALFWLVHRGVELGDARSLVGRVVQYVVGGAFLVALLLALAWICNLGFAAADAVLDWIHPALAGPWFRWRPWVICAGMLAIAALLAYALDRPGVVAAGHGIRDAAKQALSADMLVVKIANWFGVKLDALVAPYLGRNPSLADATGGLVNRWIQPLAVLAGLLAWYLRRHDGAKRIAGLDAVTTWGTAAAPAALSPAPPVPRKRIILFCDGTSNTANQKDGGVEAPTNVHRLAAMVERFDANGLPQVTIYDPGVGTETSRQSVSAGRIARFARIIGAKKVEAQTQHFAKLRALWELATGAGILENIEQGYREIARVYEPGDEVWLFGFSRGAYTVRCIAGVIARCGLLKAENLRFVPDVMLLYRRRPLARKEALVRAGFVHEKVDIAFMGLWDTVGSLGLPLWGWWFRLGALWRHQALDNNPAGICKVVCQALAMDETRSQFMPTLAEPADPPLPGQEIHQKWFRGGHAEVGGGYAEHELADIALRWIAQHARRCGLAIDDAKLPWPGRRGAHAPIRTAVMRNPNWAIFGTWPRWHPADRPDAADPVDPVRFGTLHDSVWRRARSAEPDLTGAEVVVDARAAADAIIHLPPGKTAVVTIAADRIWNRTGIVFERGAVYGIRQIDGGWRDREKTPCGAAGSEFSGIDAMRRMACWARRVPRSHYLELVGHVAHPRRWPVFEFGSIKLLRYFFIRDPWPLRGSLVALGGAENQEMYVHVAAPSGMFYAFANDLWRFYPNNSGRVLVRIRRLGAEETPPPAAPQVRVSPRGEVLTWPPPGPSRQRLLSPARHAAAIEQALRAAIGSLLILRDIGALGGRTRTPSWPDALAKKLRTVGTTAAPAAPAPPERRETWTRGET